jgi:DNA-binding transcriptional LysR family regulator
MISVWALLRAGEGVTVLPAHSAPEPETGLVFIPLRAPVLRRSMGLLKLVDGHVTPASQAFEEVAREQFRRLSGKGLRAS